MNLPAPEPDVWSSRRWLLAVLVFFLLQLAGVFLFSTQDAGLGARRQAPAFTTSMPHFNQGERIMELLAANDPGLLALPHRQGFSGAAWLTLPVRQHEWRDWSEPEHWLEKPEAPVGTAFSARLTKSIAPAMDPLLPPPLPGLTGAILPQPELIAESSARIEGALAARALPRPMTLRAWPGSEPLADSVVQVTVDAAGWVRTAAVISALGARDAAQQTADQEALQVARAARFQAVTNGAALTVGRVVFRWQTVPATMSAPLPPP